MTSSVFSLCRLWFKLLTQWRSPSNLITSASAQAAFSSSPARASSRAEDHAIRMAEIIIGMSLAR